MKSTLIGASLLFCVAIWNACDTKQIVSNERKAVHKPLPDIKTHIDKLSFNAADGGTFKLATGTVINFPKDAFVNAKGEIVKDSVSIEFEEFHDASEILLSGITMIYKENGEEKPFESAGMFRIDGKAGQEKIEIAEDKSIKIDLASKQADDGYDLFVLNEQSGQWTRINQAPISEKSETENETALNEENFNIPDLPDPTRPVLELDLNYDDYPQLQDLYGLAWQVGKGETIDEGSISAGNWKSVILESTGSGMNDFVLNLKSETEEASVKIKPVISKEKRDRLEKELRDRKKREEESRIQYANTMKTLSTFNRSLQINGFGIYNCDRTINMTAAVKIEARFMANGEEITGNYYLISNDNSAVLQYNSTFKMDASRKNKLIFIKNSDTIYYVDNLSMEKIGKMAVSTASQSYTGKIDLKKFPVKIEKESDFQAFLNQI